VSYNSHAAFGDECGLNFAAHLPLHPDRYNTDRAHACDGAVVVWFSGV
jgi:hypothetical protein